VFRFAEFELDEERYELRRGAAVIELQPKVMEVLLYLVRNADRACSKDELLDTVWDDANVSEASLVRCIAVARRALDEREGEARIIQTVRGRGYRIGVPVERGKEEPSPDLEGSSPAATSRGRRSLPWLLAAAGALIAWLIWLARPYAELPQPIPQPDGVRQPATSIAVVPTIDPAADTAVRQAARLVGLEVAERLGTIAELQVVSPAASSELVETGHRSSKQLGSDLAAGTLVFANAQGSAETLRVTLSVVDPSSGFQRWSASYRGVASSPDGLARAAADDVARVIAILVGAGPDFVRKPSPVSSLEYYLQGREATFAATRDRLLDAVTRYERAIELDPAYIDAYVALADAYERLWHADRADTGWLDRGELAVLKALELDPDDSDALATHATLLRARRQWDAAEALYRRSIELGASAYTYTRYASMLAMLGRTPEAEALVERSLELAPLDADVQRTAGRIHHYLGHHEQAVVHLLEVLHLDPLDIVAPRILASALNASGHPEEARDAFLLVTPRSIRPLARIYGRLFGRDASLRLLLEIDIARTGRPCRVDAMGTAMAWALLGERERMLECLAEQADWHLWYVLEEPVFDPYRDDPRFQEVLVAGGLPPHARRRGI
jgi:DNA-binding winged helix-turn-helix (wHTH) protein/tetratricopeptide (TPR) repeat protein